MNETNLNVFLVQATESKQNTSKNKLRESCTQVLWQGCAKVCIFWQLAGHVLIFVPLKPCIPAQQQDLQLLQQEQGLRVWLGSKGTGDTSERELKECAGLSTCLLCASYGGNAAQQGTSVPRVGWLWAGGCPACGCLCCAAVWEWLRVRTQEVTWQ